MIHTWYVLDVCLLAVTLLPAYVLLSRALYSLPSPNRYVRVKQSGDPSAATVDDLSKDTVVKVLALTMAAVYFSWLLIHLIRTFRYVCTETAPICCCMHTVPLPLIAAKMLTNNALFAHLIS